ncbi:hypothetical protein ACLB2K_068433 [Fragaria x ananassa]
MMMSLATVSPIDNLVGCRKRSRGLISDLGFIQDKTKRPKTETDLGIQQDARLAGDELSSVRFGYIRKGLGLSDDVINRLRNEITRNLLVKHKKLHLVLDLNHTLLNTTYIDKMSPEEEYLKADHSLQDVHIAGSQSQLMTKLRPHDHITKLARPSAVVILDDKKQVWRNEDQANVIELPRYHFFRSSLQKYGLSDATPYSESKTDERDRLGRAYLATVLQVLKHIHNIFFNAVELDGCELIDRDVRPVLERVKRLQGLQVKLFSALSSVDHLQLLQMQVKNTQSDQMKIRKGKT